jgi:histidine triad (HIT) family protein
MSYDDSNIFAKILRGEIPCNKIYEDDFVLSFHDINPQKKIHALVIPKGKYVDLDDFSLNAPPEEMVGLIKGINIVAKKLGISTEVGKGYRALANIVMMVVKRFHTYTFIYLEVKKLEKWLSDTRSSKKLFRNKLNSKILMKLVKPEGDLFFRFIRTNKFSVKQIFL